MANSFPVWCWYVFFTTNRRFLSPRNHDVDDKCSSTFLMWLTFWSRQWEQTLLFIYFSVVNLMNSVTYIYSFSCILAQDVNFRTDLPLHPLPSLPGWRWHNQCCDHCCRVAESGWWACKAEDSSYFYNCWLQVGLQVRVYSTLVNPCLLWSDLFLIASQICSLYFEI